MACLSFPPLSSAAEDYSSWSKATDILLNTSATGANVAGDVANVPVLVRLTSANFPFSQAGGKGNDIRFSRPDGTPLDYEIERWDSARSLADVWVRMDMVKGNASGQILRMHWGNPAAADSSDAAAVYRASDGFVAAWHLGGAGAAARPNAVAGGNAAVPNTYDGDENSAGVIAGADSLDGAAPGDFLDVGDGYTEFTAGFTYSVWVYPTAVKRWSHVLDLGNGTGNDNIIVNRVDTSAALGFHNWNGTASYQREVPGQWTLNQWQHIAVTMAGRGVRMYRNGAQILSDSMPAAITAAFRTTNFLGKSNWVPDQYFQGKLDQPELSKAARGADWIRLAYQNQRAAQTLVTVVKTVECPPLMSVSPDTVVPEGGLLSLDAGVECAASWFWSVLSGPGPRILEPDSKTQTIRIPRVTGDTAITYRLTAVFGDSTRMRDVRVGIKEAIPDPVFTMPAMTWSGGEHLAYRPVISNLAAIKATRDSVLHWEWTLGGTEAQWTPLPDGVTLVSAAAEGEVEIGLCLDNGASPVCRTGKVQVTGAATSVSAPVTAASAGNIVSVQAGRDALGRASTPRRGFRRGVFAFPAK